VQLVPAASARPPPRIQNSSFPVSSLCFVHSTAKLCREYQATAESFASRSLIERHSFLSFNMRGLNTLAAVATALVGRVAAQSYNDIPEIEVYGQHFFYANNGSQLYV
jgi:hypothetical protein